MHNAFTGKPHRAARRLVLDMERNRLAQNEIRPPMVARGPSHWSRCARWSGTAQRHARRPDRLRAQEPRTSQAAADPAMRLPERHNRACTHHERDFHLDRPGRARALHRYDRFPPSPADQMPRRQSTMSRRSVQKSAPSTRSAESGNIRAAAAASNPPEQQAVP